MTRRHEMVQRAEGYLREYLAACQETEGKPKRLHECNKKTFDPQLTSQTQVVNKHGARGKNYRAPRRLPRGRYCRADGKLTRREAEKFAAERSNYRATTTRTRELRAPSHGGVLEQEKTKEAELQEPNSNVTTPAQKNKKSTTGSEATAREKLKSGAEENNCAKG
jgi:hypothetical protein